MCNPKKIIVKIREVRLVVLAPLIKAFRTQIPTSSTLRRANFIIFSKRQRTTTMIDLHLKKNLITLGTRFTLFHPQRKSERQVKRERKWRKG